MIVGGNFVGKGAEAMLLTVRDAVVGRFPGASCCIEISSEERREEYASRGLLPVRRRMRTLGQARAEYWLTTRAGVRPGRLDARELHRRHRGILNPYRCTDAVIDISGFSGSDEFGPQAAEQRFRDYEHAKASGNRIILMPQSWGPFRNPVVAEYVARLVRIADLVFARERESLEYLSELPGVDTHRILLGADIAFQFSSKGPEVAGNLLASLGFRDDACPLVGVSPNMRIVERTPGKGGENSYFRSLVGVGRWFVENTRANLVLIPHEYTPGRANDPDLCAELAAALGAPERVASLTGREPAADIKALIGRLDFLVASRYHSLVAAMSMRTPVAVLGWSHKYDELMALGGLSDWVLDPARRPGADAQRLMAEAWSEREAVRTSLVRNVPQLESSAQGALERMLAELARG